MDLNKSEITGVILAGGKSRRMGFNKAEAEMHGESMLIRMIDKLKTVTPTIIVSVGSTRYPNIPLTQVVDEYQECGPIGGIYSVLKASSSSFNLVVSCDIPLVSVTLLKYIVDRAIKADSTITVPIDEEGQIQMMCAVYRKDVLPILEQQINQRAFKMKDLLDLVSVEYVNISRKHPLYREYAFMNVNNPSNLEEARKLWSGQKKQ